MTYKIYNKSSEDMSELDNGSVKMILAGPGWGLLNKYGFEPFITMMKECHRVLRPDGILFLNIGHPIDTDFDLVAPFISHVSGFKGNSIFYPTKYALIATDIGFIPREDIVIVKDCMHVMITNEGWRSFAYKDDKMLYCDHEHLFMYSKTHDFVLNDPDISDLWFTDDNRHDVMRWISKHIEEGDRVSLPFMKDIVGACLELTTQEGDTVLDPCSGTGTLMVVAESMNRDSIGYDTDPLCCKLAHLRLEEGI